MKRAEVLQEIRMMRFEEAYYGWQEQRLTQDEAAYLPGVCERAFRTHQERLPKEPALAGISDMEEANRYIAEIYLPDCNEEFAAAPPEAGDVFVPRAGGDPDHILCGTIPERLIMTIA